MFKQDFKYYKSKVSPQDLTNVLNFEEHTKIEAKITPITFSSIRDCELYGLKPVEKWKGYEVISNPGLIYVRNPFTPSGQQYWITQCLQSYTMPPNKSNLDAQGVIPENSNWWQMCQDNINLVEKLRWITLGYHHDWDTKVYSESKNNFPDNLAGLSNLVASAVGYTCFKAEAAIVNYYHMGSTLSGHTDHSEKLLEAPLLSFSFGQSAIFLLGGTTLDVKPAALLLQSGDIVIMSKESRLCYHAVPKILKSFDEPWEMNLNDNFLKFCRFYMKKSRININVRQVF